MMEILVSMMMMMTGWFGGWGRAIYNTLVGAAEGRRPTSGGRLSFIPTHGSMQIHGQFDMYGNDTIRQKNIDTSKSLNVELCFLLYKHMACKFMENWTCMEMTRKT